MYRKSQMMVTVVVSPPVNVSRFVLFRLTKTASRTSVIRREAHSIS